jgi:hypothetical protein
MMLICASTMAQPASVAMGATSIDQGADVDSRTALGLPATGPAIGKALFSTAWGAYLTPDEEDLLNLRASVQVSLTAARASVRAHADSAVGVYFDQDAGGYLTVALSRTASAGIRGAITAALPTVLPYRVITVPRSLADLEAIQAKVIANVDTYQADGSTVASVGLDPMHDVVARRRAYHTPGTSG